MNNLSSQVIIDVEADGPCPGIYSMVCFGAVSLDDSVEPFYGKVRPISSNWIPDALAVSGFTREEHEDFPEVLKTTSDFFLWCNKLSNNSNNRLTAWSDNPAFDWQWINYYMHLYHGRNPFGFSARRIGDFASGLNGNWKDHSSWKKLRETKHNHDPVQDCKGNAEALKKLISFADLKKNKGEKNG